MTGQYEDNDGSSLVVLEQAGVLEVHGMDRGSVYRLVCTVNAKNPDAADCVDDDINTEGTLFRFTYRSQRRRTAAGTFNEEWQASYAQGSRSGKGQFRLLPASTGQR